MARKIKDEKYLALIDQAFEMFNNEMETDYSRDNMDVRLINAGNADRVIAEVMSEYPDAHEDAMLEPGYYKQIKAQTFVSPGHPAIIIRTDIEEQGLYWRHAFLHELCHVFCGLNELPDGRDFYGTYCEGWAESSYQDGAINGGYAIWREFAAELLAFETDEDMAVPDLGSLAGHINFLLDEIDKGVPDIRECIMALLIDLMEADEIINAESQDELFEKIRMFDRLQTASWHRLIGLVFDKLTFGDEPYWEINVDFIESLGSAYISIKSEVMMKLTDGGRDKEKQHKLMRGEA